MKNKTEDILIQEMERIRRELHQKVGKKPIISHEILMKEELLELSRDLDKLIIQYMLQKSKQ
ncbi:Spo0E family sporulation regulatory protein-aspartic acid phosphatase [Tepidibacillus sp. LV47]|uniref:Spo0E family sporulation regulatory protein-aspartic acid phosphatase n=1 Tax=Tepidibacillus sp. LV47 TaxID=3398228 RepID=UPI003AAF4182